MFKYAGIILSGMLLLLAGCTSVYQGPESQPPPREWSETNTVTEPPRPNPSVVKLNPMPPPISRPTPILTWTSLDRWAAENRLAAPHKILDSPVTAYAVSSRQGTMVLEIGSREATWNGVELNLGFTPEFIDGQVFLYGLDLQKNLEPLLLDPPLTFGPGRVIVIDPGHGGSKNTGTYSVLDGRFEKEFTLDWARRLKPLLEAEGWMVFLTRTSDVYVTNSDRVVFAGAHHADLFISLHFNSTEQDKKTGERDEKTGGLETYCLTPAGMPSTLTRGFADLWNENLPNNDFDAQNLQLAFRVHRAVLHVADIDDRGIRRSRFDTVLRGQNRPAILIEGGYLSNPAEAKLIESPEYRQKLAEGVAAALK